MISVSSLSDSFWFMLVRSSPLAFIVGDSRSDSSGPCIFVFWWAYVFSIPVHGTSGRPGWVLDVCHIPFRVCYVFSFSLSRYYLIDGLSIQLSHARFQSYTPTLLHHSAMSTSTKFGCSRVVGQVWRIACVIVSALRTVLTLSSDLDQLLRNGRRP